MNEIKAFVGHSFSPDDSLVVGKLTNYLDQVEGLVPNFSWAHAEPAEPETLDKKVLRIISDKNVFIGICTVKECAAKPVMPIKILFEWLHLKPKTPCELKTSDWIIQEIGLAVGRNMRLILLTEEGLRKPGGLQGDVEYIPFNRNAPEKAFGKILEMIKALKTKDPFPPITAGPAPAEEDEQQKAAEMQEGSWLAPTSSWQRRQYQFAFMHYTAVNETVKAQEIASNYFATTECSDIKNIQSFKAFEEYTRLYFGKGGQLKNLKEMAVTNSQNSGVLEQLAKAYKYFDDHEQAAHIFKQAADNAAGIEKLKYLSSAATEYLAANNNYKSNEIVQELKCLAKDNEDGEIILLDTISEMAKEQNELQLAIMERTVELNPSDADARFKLGYKHSQNDNEKLALMHYLRIDADNRDPMTWNNLGVAFDLFKMPAKAVIAFRKSIEGDTTLAMSNLANKFSRSGFLEEAEALCNLALRIPDYEKRILGSLSRIKDIPGEEDKKEKEVVEGAQALSRFYARAGEAVSRNLAAPLDGKWVGKTYTLDVRVSDQKFTATGLYDVNMSGGLAASLFSSAPEIITWKVLFKGECYGAAILGRATLNRGNSSTLPSLLMSGDQETVFLIFISSDGSEMEVMEKSKDAAIKFSKFSKEITSQRQISAG